MRFPLDVCVCHPHVTARVFTNPDCFAEILEFVAFIKLRVSHRDMHRPYEIPLDTVGVCLLLLPATSFVLLLAAFSSVITWVVSGVALLIGVGLYPGLLLAKREKWCEFRSATRYEGDVDGADNAPLYGN